MLYVHNVIQQKHNIFSRHRRMYKNKNATHSVQHYSAYTLYNLLYYRRRRRVLYKNLQNNTRKHTHKHHKTRELVISNKNITPSLVALFHIYMQKKKLSSSLYSNKKLNVCAQQDVYIKKKQRN